MHWATALVSFQVFAAVVYWIVETVVASFESSFVDSGVDRQLDQQLVLYHVAILVFPFVEPHFGAVVRG